MPNRFIDKLSTFGKLNKSDIARLVAATSERQIYSIRQDLIREGDRAGAAFVVLEGWACRYKILPRGTRQNLGYLMPGACCDLHVGLLGEVDHSIQVITPAKVAIISRKDMDTILRRHPNLAKALYNTLLVDGRTTRAWIASMGRRSSAQRVAHLMCELYLRARSIGLASDGSDFALPLSQGLLADSLGMTTAHINRVLKELRLSGAVTQLRGGLLINDPAKLIRVAGFDDSYLHRRLRRPV